MTRYVYKGISLDQETAELLKQIAEQKADGETPNDSLTIRRMIREEAKKLGISIQAQGNKKPRTTKAVAA